MAKGPTVKQNMDIPAFVTLEIERLAGLQRPQHRSDGVHAGDVLVPQPFREGPRPWPAASGPLDGNVADGARIQIRCGDHRRLSLICGAATEPHDADQE